VRLTEHFDSREFRSRDGAGVPLGHARELRDLCRDYLEPLREVYGPVTIVSGYRTATHNARVGGASESRHLAVPGRRGAAADIVCRRGSPREWYRWLDARGVGGLGFYPTFVHVDNRSGRARW
jgi:uncharacterized protein YcbK (DUF882 family)